MSQEPVISERMAERAAELWKRMLRNPKYDALGGTGSPREKQSMGMASAMAHMLPSNATEDLLDKFAVELKKRLLDASVNFYQRSSLCVDYGPDATLAESATAVGLKMEFPWKTHMRVGEDHISFSCGYGAEIVNHYPLSDDRWLLTTLYGSDIGKVIEYVQGGKPEFMIEEPETCRPSAVSAVTR